jgi:3-methyladenine DNA glycosylase AlkD
LQYKEKTNTQLLEKYMVNCLGSNEFFINKAIGWALRAYAYTHKKWVVRFVKDHPQLSNLSKREALKHI